MCLNRRFGLQFLSALWLSMIAGFILSAGNELLQNPIAELNGLEDQYGTDSLIHFLEERLYSTSIQYPNQWQIDQMTELVRAYIRNSDYTNALAGVNKLDLWLENDNSEKIIKAAQLRTTIWYRLGNYQESLKTVDKVIALCRARNDSIGVFVNMLRKGVLIQESGNNQEALSIYRETELYMTDSTSRKLRAILFTSYAVAHDGLGRIDSSLHYDQLALNEDKKTEPLDVAGIIQSYSNLGAALTNLLEFERAADCFDSARLYLESEEYFLVRDDSIRLLGQVMMNEATLLAEKGQFGPAKEIFDQYVILRNGEVQNQTTIQIAELERLHIREKEHIRLHQQREIEQFNQRQWILLLIIALLLTLGCLVGLGYFQKSKLDKAELARLFTEQKLLRSQMNPHFVFNAVSAIQSLIFSKDNKRAAKYLARFAKLMRSMLENSTEKFVQLETELNTLDEYVALQQLRFNDAFSYNVEIKDEIEPENILIPPMLLQPFIENAIEHGIRNLQNGRIELTIFMKEENMMCEIRDNGIGIQESLKQSSVSSEKRSMATGITKGRLKALGKELKQKTFIQMFDRNTVGTKGTIVLIQIPFQKKS